VTQTWDAAGRRSTLNDASSSLPAPLFSYAHRADGLLSQVTFNSQLSTFNYADNGLLTSRVNPFRVMTVDMRDSVGRILQQTQGVNNTAPLVENMTWRNNSTLNNYTATRTGTGVWNESRAYAYDSRGQLLSEGFSLAGLAPALSSSNGSSLNYSFDGNNPGLGIRTDAKIGTGAPASWETNATPNSLGQVTTDNQVAASGQVVPASGNATGAARVNILVDGVTQGLAGLSGGTWSINLDLATGSHTLTANAVDPSGLYTTSATSNFTVTAGNPSAQAGTVTSAYDGDGNVVSRSWSNGTVQLLTWDAFDRLIGVSQRDNSDNGYNWSAVYDGLGRRLSTTQQPVANNVDTGAPTVTASIYDPQVEFLEIGVNVNGVQAWKVYGPDISGKFGGMQGTGGLEAVVMDAGGAATGVISDYFGNGVATISGGSVTWNTTRVGGFGPLPDSPAQPLTSAAQLASAVCWRGHYIDPTGFYWIGKRYYEPVSGRWLSCDPLGYAASSSLYEFAGNDPVNNFDPDGRIFGTGLTMGEFFGAAWTGASQSVVGSTLIQTGASGVETYQAAVAEVAGVAIGDTQAGHEVDRQYSNQAMENSVSGQTLNNGGSLAQASAAASLMGATMTTFAAAPAAFAGGEALMGYYTAGQLGAGGLGTFNFVAANAGLNAGLSVASGAATQEMATGTINGGQLAFSALVGAGFGGLSGVYGSKIASMEANAVQAEGQAAFDNATGRYLDMTDAEIDASYANAEQQAFSAAATGAAISGADATGSPWVQTYAESWLDSKIFPEPPDSGGKGCGN
jgi:RHS repeat-associated protein